MSTPAHLLCEWPFDAGRVEALKVLVQAGVNIEAKNKEGETPAHKAAAYGVQDTLKVLVEAKANLEVQGLSLSRSRSRARALSLYLSLILSLSLFHIMIAGYPYPRGGIFLG